MTAADNVLQLVPVICTIEDAEVLSLLMSELRDIAGGHINEFMTKSTNKDHSRVHMALADLTLKTQLNIHYKAGRYDLLKVFADNGLALFRDATAFDPMEFEMEKVVDFLRHGLVWPSMMFEVIFHFVNHYAKADELEYLYQAGLPIDIRASILEPEEWNMLEQSMRRGRLDLAFVAHKYGVRLSQHSLNTGVYSGFRVRFDELVRNIFEKGHWISNAALLFAAEEDKDSTMNSLSKDGLKVLRRAYYAMVAASIWED